MEKEVYWSRFSKSLATHDSIRVVWSVAVVSAAGRDVARRNVR
jgi:hypothetical protein